MNAIDRPVVTSLQTAQRLLFILPRARTTQDKMLVVIEEALRRGIICEALYYDEEDWRYVCDQLGDRCSALRCKTVPVHLRWFMRRHRSARLSIRVALWIAAKQARCFEGYDGAVAADDTEPLEYVVGSRVRLLIFQSTVDYFDQERTIKRLTLEPHERPLSWLGRVSTMIDSAMNGRILPRIAGRLTKFDPGRALVDALFGSRPVPATRGMGTARFFCVAGTEYITINRALGVSKEKLIATGLFDFDPLLRIASDIDSDQSNAILSEIGGDPSKPVVTFFSSPQRVLGERHRTHLDDFQLICEAINRWLPGHQIVFKHHPKFADGEDGFRAVDTALADIRNLIVIRQHSGADLNAKLVAVSALVISPGTMGMSAAALLKPVLSYSFGSEHWDAINKTLQLSVHVRNEQELNGVLRQFQSNNAFDGLVDRQKVARERFFKANGRAAEEAIEALLGCQADAPEIRVAAK